MKNKVFIILTILSLLMFEDGLQLILPFFRYTDEIFAFSAILILLVGMIFRRGMNLQLFWKVIACGLFVFSVLNILGFIINSSQPINALLVDGFLSLKFFLGILLGYQIFGRGIDFDSKKIEWYIKIVTSSMFFLLLVNYLFQIFPNQGSRFGVPIPSLFFTHSEYLAAAATLLLVMTFKVYKKGLKFNYFILMQVFIIFSTFRYKAMATAIIGAFLFVLVVVVEKKIQLKHVLIMISSIVFLARDQILVYYGNSFSESARGMLTIKAFEIAKDYFPLGVGFGTYASYMSRVYYSQVYDKYDLSSVWGLSNSPESVSFISDTFWPMILGQGGFIGLIVYICIITYIVIKIASTYRFNRFSYLSGMLAMAYLLIQSTAASAFVSPSSVQFGIWIGLIIGESYTFKNELHNTDGFSYESKSLPVLYDSKDKCCGCSACYSICSINAIKMKADEEGFLYPEIAESDCVGCGRCKIVCPIANNN